METVTDKFSAIASNIRKAKKQRQSDKIGDVLAINQWSQLRYNF